MAVAEAEADALEHCPDFRDTWAASQPVEGDGAITALGGAALGIQTADCVPILIADKNARVDSGGACGLARASPVELPKSRCRQIVRLTV